MNYFTAIFPLANSTASSWRRKNRKQTLNDLNPHQFTLTPALSLLWVLPVWMQKQQHSFNYVMYQSWGFCTALYSSKALGIEFLDTLTQLLQHEPVEQNPCVPHICHTFCLYNQKQTSQEAAQKHLLLRTHITDWQSVCQIPEGNKVSASHLWFQHKVPREPELKSAHSV